MTGFYDAHSRFLVSVDCIVFGFDGVQLEVLIGKRKMDPGRGQWSLYGGFVNSDENIDEAAQRVLYELTGLDHLYMKQTRTYGAIDRDPGERVISVAYCALINVKDYDDKRLQQYRLEWVPLEKLPMMYSDHNKMVDNAVAMLRQRIKTEPLSFNLLPDLFTLTQLQHVYEAVLGHEIDKRNFRKRIKQIDVIEKTEHIDKKTSKRGAALYRFNKQAYNDAPTFRL